MPTVLVVDDDPDICQLLAMFLGGAGFDVRTACDGREALHQGVVTDGDLVCRVVAVGKNPLEHTVQDCMSQPAITVHPDTTLTDVMTTMERHQIRRVPVVNDHERCVGIVAQADLAWAGPQKDVAVLVQAVCRPSISVAVAAVAY